ncbi:MAG: hypothetical protein V7K76_00110 [Nostoc sp.]
MSTGFVMWRYRYRVKFRSSDRPIEISSVGLRRNSPRTIVLSKFSSASSFNMLLALFYEQAGDRASLVGQTSLDSFLESLAIAAVAVADKLLLPIGA